MTVFVPLKGTLVSGIPRQTFPEGLAEELEAFKVRPTELDSALTAWRGGAFQINTWTV